MSMKNSTIKHDQRRILTDSNHIMSCAQNVGDYKDN